MPKCYARIVLMFDYKIDDLEKPVTEFLEKFCPIAFGKIVYDETKPNSGQLIELSSHSNQIFSRTEQENQSINYFLQCSFQELDIFPYSAFPTAESPLFFLHQINLTDGTLLVFGIHHHLSDGHGFFSLIDRFSRWFRNKNDPDVRPLINDRSLLEPSNEILYEHIEYTTKPPIFSFTTPPEMDVIVKKFSKRSLFEKLNIVSSDVSFNDVLVAWLTKTISEIRQIPRNETVKMGMATNGREEFRLGSDYFGNCNFFLCIEFPMSDLIDKSVNDLAQLVHSERKTRLNKTYLSSALAWVKAATEPIFPGFQSFCGRDVAFTNWSRFPAFQIDFGHGRPRRLALPPARFDGLVLILPTPSDEIEFYIGLKRDHAEEFLRRLE